MTVREWLDLAEEALADVESSKLEAAVLLAHSLGEDRAWVYAHGDEFLRARDEVDALLERRQKGEPLAYLLGYREFHGRRFSVGPGVLIPRQETEVLVEAGLNAIDRGLTSVFDLGCGSGCIGISLKLERSRAEVTLGDVSEAALEFSRANAETLGAEVSVVRSDCFEAFEKPRPPIGDRRSQCERRTSGRRFDIIVSNPPYIGRTEMLPDEVVLHEPETALFADEGGLAVIRRIAEEAHEHLTEKGELWLEVGYLQADSVRSIFESSGWSFVVSLQDLLRHERVLSFKR